MSDGTLTAIAALFAWFVYTLLADLMVELFWTITSPIWRPVWNVFVRARGPGPLLGLLTIGGAAIGAGIWTWSRDSQSRWVGGLGLLLLVGGVAVTFMAPMLWREARRAGAKGGAPPADIGEDAA